MSLFILLSSLVKYVKTLNIISTDFGRLMILQQKNRKLNPKDKGTTSVTNFHNHNRIAKGRRYLIIQYKQTFINAVAIRLISTLISGLG